MGWPACAFPGRSIEDGVLRIASWDVDYLGCGCRGGWRPTGVRVDVDNNLDSCDVHHVFWSHRTTI